MNEVQVFKINEVSFKKSFPLDPRQQQQQQLLPTSLKCLDPSHIPVESPHYKAFFFSIVEAAAAAAVATGDKVALKALFERTSSADDQESG